MKLIFKYFWLVTLISSPLMAEDDPIESYKSLETLAKGIYYLETMYVDEEKVSTEQLVDSALAGMAQDLDPHTTLLPKKAFEQLTIDTQGKFGGVGIIVSHESGKLVVVSPIDDTPADRAGIKAGDIIVEIDGEKITKTNMLSAIENMRGLPGSKIKFVISRAKLENENEFKTLTFTIKREVIKVQSVKSNSLSSDILYTRISSFKEETTRELRKVIEKHKDTPIKGLILDLRDNPGGLLDQAVEVSDLFIKSGILVSTVGRHKDKVERHYAKPRGTLEKFPIVVIINNGSASASEIVAGALQDHERALILGTTSFGKGSVQTLITLPNGTGLKMTVARYYTPKDRSIQAKGISPDIVLNYQDLSKKETSAQAKPIKKEQDLKGHINSEDLSDMANESGLLATVKSWPAHLKNDNQIRTSYAYLRSFSRLKNLNQKTPKVIP